MSCSCSDFDGPAVYRESIHRARKPYRCAECGVDIAPETRYQRCFGVWDGSPSTYRLCLDCGDLCTALHPLCECWTFGSVLSQAEEVLREPPDELDQPPPPEGFAQALGHLAGLVWRARERSGAVKKPKPPKRVWIHIPIADEEESWPT